MQFFMCKISKCYILDMFCIIIGGIRLGTPAMTTRGLVESDMIKVAEFLHRGVQLSLKIQKSLPSDSLVKLAPFLSALEESVEFQNELNSIRKDVSQFATTFPYPGIRI